MADGFDIDFREINELAADLGQVASNAGQYVRTAQDKSSLAIKTAWAESVSGFPNAAAYPRAISYDFLAFQGFGSTVLTTEIGPDKGRRQGALGNLIEYGSVKNAPGNYGDAALQGEAAHFEQLLSEALARAEFVLGVDASFVKSLGAGLTGSY